MLIFIETNQKMKKPIKLDEFNHDEIIHHNPNDWLSNAFFCLKLDDPRNELNDNDKIASLMRALKGNMKESLFAKLREVKTSELTLQKFQEIFLKHTTKTNREIENRLAKISENTTASYQDLYRQIESLITEQMKVAGGKEDSNNKEIIKALTERMFRKKCHKDSETFQTSTKSGQELIDLASELNEFKKAFKSINTLIKIEPRKKCTRLITEESNDRAQQYYSYQNNDNQEDYDWGNRQMSVRRADFPQQQYWNDNHFNNNEEYWTTQNNSNDYNDNSDCNNPDYNYRPFYTDERY